MLNGAAATRGRASAWLQSMAGPADGAGRCHTGAAAFNLKQIATSSSGKEVPCNAGAKLSKVEGTSQLSPFLGRLRPLLNPLNPGEDGSG